MSLAMLAVDYLIMAVAPSLWLLFVGRLLAGISGATYSTATAYIADVTPREGRAAAFGLVGAAFGVGFILGPAIGGLMGELGTRAPFYAAAAFAVLNFAYGWFVLPESLAPENRRPFDWRRANPLGAVRQLGRLPGLRPLLLVYFLYQVAFAVYPSVWSYFGQERFGWTPAIIGLSLALFGGTMALVQGGLIAPLLRLLGERRTVMAGYGFAVLAYGGLSVLSSGPVALVLTPLAALAGVIPPALQGIMSRRVAANAQGELQGALTSASALAMIASPLVMTATFARFSGPQAPIYLPGAPFVLAMVLTLIGAAIFLNRLGPARDGDLT
jgi:DHA1 family tetracycline resistance protein-like MFS transporter